MRNSCIQLRESTENIYLDIRNRLDCEIEDVASSRYMAPEILLAKIAKIHAFYIAAANKFAQCSTEQRLALKHIATIRLCALKNKYKQTIHDDKFWDIAHDNVPSEAAIEAWLDLKKPISI